MKLSLESLKVLAAAVTGDDHLGKYRTWDDLEKFLHSIGGELGSDMGGTSRQRNALNRLAAYNGSYRLVEVIMQTLDAHCFLDREEAREQLVVELNKHLKFDGYQIVLDDSKCQIQSFRKSEVLAENVDRLSDDFISEQLRKCDSKMLAGDYDGAISNARSLVEAVLGRIHEELTGQSLQESGDLQKDFRKVRDLLNMSPEKYTDEPIRQILNGFYSIIQGIDSLSNKLGDRHRRRYKPALRHARLVTNGAKTLVDFLVDSYKSKLEEIAPQQIKETI